MNLSNIRGPKQLLQEASRTDEFHDVIILGVDKNNNLKIHWSSDNVMFLSTCLAFLTKITTDKFQTSSPISEKRIETQC